MGRSPGCKGCEAMFITGEPARPHSDECWTRITSILESTEDGQATLARAQTRMEQYRSIIADSVSPESCSVAAPPPAAAHWPAAGEEAADDDSDDDDMPSLLAAD